MGVPAFYKKLIQKYKNITFALRELLNEQQHIFLYIDFNAMIHPCMSNIIRKYINKQNYNRNIIEVEIFEEIKTELLKIINKIKPKLVFIATDGVAPLAKMEQQRKRRYKSIKDNKDKSRIFDSNSISPGTPFMRKLSNYMQLFIDNELKKICKVIYSDHTQVGEGEHKIIKFINQLKKDNQNSNIVHIINSLDADLIMLSLQLNINNIYLLREKQQFEEDKEIDIDEIDSKYHFLNIMYVKEYLWNELNRNYNYNDIISKNDFFKDFIFLCFFIGNDFLPSFKFLNVYDNGIEQIFEEYKDVLKKNKKKLLNDTNINKNVLLNILKKFKDNEEDFNNKNNKVKYDKIVRYYENGWKNRYYSYFINSNYQNDIDNMCFNFCQMLKWTTLYYFKGTKNWSFFYKYRGSPCISDLYNFIQKNDINKIFIPNDKPVTMNQQLMIILPPQSSYLISKKYNYLMFSKLKHLYPTHFKLDKVDKKYPWMFIPILPSINLRLIKENVY